MSPDAVNTLQPNIQGQCLQTIGVCVKNMPDVFHSDTFSQFMGHYWLTHIVKNALKTGTPGDRLFWGAVSCIHAIQQACLDTSGLCALFQHDGLLELILSHTGNVTDFSCAEALWDIMYSFCNNATAPFMEFIMGSNYGFVVNCIIPEIRRGRRIFADKAIEALTSLLHTYVKQMSEGLVHGLHCTKRRHGRVSVHCAVD